MADDGTQSSPLETSRPFHGSDVTELESQNKYMIQDAKDATEVSETTETASAHAEENDLPTTNIHEISAESTEECTKEQDEYSAAAAAALADFEAEDDGVGNSTEDDNDDDDTVNVIIKPTSKGGIYKTGAAYQARSVAHSQYSKTTRQGIALDDPGDIHGVPTIEFNLSTLGEEDKPWKRPGADITDYFNYGFTEETWIQYCEKQKILRQEYANATLKPVLSGAGTGLLQRVRTGGANTGIRSYDNFKPTSINVINLSNVAIGNRSSGTGLLSQKDSTDVQSAVLNGANTSTSSLLGQFTQPPPGYLSGTPQLDGANGTAGTTGSGVLAFPPPGFSTQLLTTPNAANTGSTNNVFPNLNIPPPVLSGLTGNWPGSLGVHNLINPGDALIDPTTGQLTGLLDQSRRSPESVYSNEDRSSRRSRRHYQEEGYFERDSYRSSRRRSRSGSRDRHYSRHHRWSPIPTSYHDSRRSERDYERGSRHSHRSREGRYSGGTGPDDMMEEGFCPPTSAILSSRSGERRSHRDRHSERSSDRDRSGHRSSRRDRERSSRSSRRSRHRSGSRTSTRRDFESPSKSPTQIIPEDAQAQDGPSSSTKLTDPLAVAAARAANIAAALSSTN